MKSLKPLKVALGALLLTGLASAKPVWPPQNFSCYYGDITPQVVEQLKDLELLVVHPGDDFDNLSKANIEQLRQKGKEKTIVGYVTIGEDDRPPGGPPIKGKDTSGPSFVGENLTRQKANNGYPSRFLDQIKFVFGDDGFLKFGPNGKPLTEKGQDGHPDENGVWGSFYVRADDPAWRTLVFQKMDDLVELGLDGFFLDTVDTASPWGDYGWTSPAMLDLVQAIRKRYPDKKIVANRGLFYLSQSDRYAKLIDAVLFESVLTHYNWETESGDISPWAKGHVDALNDDVMPAQKRTGLHLLVLDYLNPEQSDALSIVQSNRTLLKNTPHSLSFSHPSLRIPGWTPSDLLPEAAPAKWPSLQKIEITETKPGTFFLAATFDGDIPQNALPDLRITDRTDVKPNRAAQLPSLRGMNWKFDGPLLTIDGNGLDKNHDYTAYLRLISRSVSPQSDFGWTQFHSADSELPSQVKNISYSSVPKGVELNFTGDPLAASSYRIYQVKEGKNTLLREVKSAPVLLDHLAFKQSEKIRVVGVDEKGREGYPSEITLIIRNDVTAPAPPGAVEVLQQGKETRFHWQSAPEASVYHLYVIPKNQTFRLPALTSDTELSFSDIVPGEYKVFITAVDEDGNQSRPGPTTTIKIR